MPTAPASRRTAAIDRSESGSSPGKSAPAGRSRATARLVVWLSILAASVLLLGTGAATARWWFPHIQGLLGASAHESHAADEGDHDGDHTEAADAAGHAGHAGQDHPGHDDATAVALSDQGRKNVGLKLVPVELKDFARTISVPAVLVDRSGRTQLNVSAPMTGIVTQIYPIRGEAVTPGAPLFTLRLTHEDVVEKQSQLLQYLEELDVVKREIARLEDVTASGAVAGKLLLDRQYEQQKIEAALRAQKQALILHGLTEDQVKSIEDDRRLLSVIVVPAPSPRSCLSEEKHEEFLQVAALNVQQGEHVEVGTSLATLTDHCELYVEGKAFEQDAPALNEATEKGAPVTALINANGSGTREVGGLQILYVENEVELDSRALKFYVRLPNELVRNQQTEDGHRFIGWRYKPGQRVELLVPVERWQQQIVLPVEAVVQEGAESYVYQEIKGHFDRKNVHVVYRDQRHAVIESDGILFPGDKVAAQGAYQIHLDLKNKSGGGPDPHAGHHH
jgi:multidrug efflux pump subunit AcrA (membrane-fusion protein)